MSEGELGACCDCEVCQQQLSGHFVLANERAAGFFPVEYQGYYEGEGAFLELPPQHPRPTSPPSTFYRAVTFRRDGLRNIGTDDPRYVSAFQVERFWVHPEMGDVYRYERSDSVNGLMQTWVINDDGSRTDWSLPNPVSWNIALPFDRFRVYHDTAHGEGATWTRTQTSDAPVFVTDSVILEDPIDLGMRYATTWLDNVNLHGNNEVIVEDGSIVTTGFGSPRAFFPWMISVEYRRTPAGLRLVNRKGVSGEMRFVGAAGTFAFGFGLFAAGGASNGLSIGGVKVVWQAAKCKIASNDPRVTLLKFQGKIGTPPQDYADVSQLLANGLTNFTVDMNRCEKRTAGPAEDGDRCYPEVWGPSCYVLHVGPADAPVIGYVEPSSNCHDEPACVGKY